MAAISDWLKSSLRSIKHEYFSNVVSIENADIQPMGDGQFVIISNINRVTLVLKTSDGKKKELKAIAKLEPTTGPGMEMASSCEAFATETMMYSEVLEPMKKLMLDAGENQPIWADCYHIDENKFLFEDLCEDGYRVVPSYKFLDVDHALLVMKAIGKFHGVSLVMKEKGLLDSSRFKNPYFARKLPFMDVMASSNVQILAQFMREKWEPEWSSIADRMMKYLEKPGELLFNSWESTKGKWDVLCHGDFTIRNMLFHYGPESTRPDAVKFVDFQMCHFSNLSNDLIMLLYTSIRPPVREKNMKLFLQTYVDSLSAASLALGYKKPVPSLEDVESSIRSQTPLIVYQVIFSVPFFIACGKEDVQKKADEYLEKFGSISDFVNAQSKQSESEMMTDYNDPDVKEILQFEFKRFVKENVF